MSVVACAWCHAPMGPFACSACGRSTIAGLRPGVWVLDRYRITQPLGESGIGRTWLGVDEAGHEVSICALHHSMFRIDTARERFVEALRRFQEYSHPHAQPTLAVGALADGAPTWVGAWRTGPTLAAVLFAGTMHPSDASRTIEQVALALGALHHRGLAHGDLKPETVQCMGEAMSPGDAWITEIGHLAALVTSRATEATGTVLGTPAYMAPERFTGTAPSASSDLYALGLLAYEMFEGRSPYDANSPWEWATCHLTREPRPWTIPTGPLAAPPRMRSAIWRCLAKEPQARFATAEEFLLAAREPAQDLFGPGPFGPGPYRGRG